MTVLVTGATGFVGSHLLDELLARKARVRALVRGETQADSLRQRGLEVCLGDIRDPLSVGPAVKDAAIVYHCAAAVGPQHSKKTIFETNLQGVGNVLEALRQAGQGRLVFLSSINVLGTRNLDPASEDLPYRTSSDPAADVKIEAEKLVLDYHRRHGLEAAILRPGFIYGPRDPHNLPRLIHALRRGKFLFIGSRRNIVPIVHVQDVVQALLLAGQSPRANGRVYHILDGSRTTIGEFVDCLCDLLGCPRPQKVQPFFLLQAACVTLGLIGKVLPIPSPLSRAALRFLGTSRYGDIGRAREELGYEPRVFYRAGLSDALRWHNQQTQAENHVPCLPA